MLEENYDFVYQDSERIKESTAYKLTKEDLVKLNVLQINLTEKQKQALLQKQQRVQQGLLKIEFAKTKTALENYAKYNQLNDYYKYTLIGDNYWHIMNGDSKAYVNVPISDTRYWYYFNEHCFTDRDLYLRNKKIDADSLILLQQAYQKAKIEFVVKDNVEPIKTIIEIAPEPVIETPIEGELKLDAKIVLSTTTPEIKQETNHEVKRLPRSEVSSASGKIKNKPNKNEGQASLF